MTTVMSTLRNLSEKTGVPYHHLTRAISGTIVALYAAKLSYPYVRQYMGCSSAQTKEKKNTALPGNGTVARQVNASGGYQNAHVPDNDQTLGSEALEGELSPNDALLKIVQQYEKNLKGTLTVL